MDRKVRMRLATWAAMVLAIAASLGYVLLVPLGYSAKFGEQKTVATRLQQYGQAARGRLLPDFAAVGVSYPPQRGVLLTLKSERKMEVWAGREEGPLHLVRTYPIHGLSGVAGPKLREGDRQVPEGIYAIDSLNPNSRYHLSLRVGYPNEFDRRQAAADGRTKLGGDIMIHGGSSSIGCIAVGDEAVEDLFVLAAETGIEKVRVIICPSDPRKGEMACELDKPWVGELYEEIAREVTAATRDY